MRCHFFALLTVRLDAGTTTSNVAEDENSRHDKDGKDNPIGKGKSSLQDLSQQGTGLVPVTVDTASSGEARSTSMMLQDQKMQPRTILNVAHRKDAYPPQRRGVAVRDNLATALVGVLVRAVNVVAAAEELEDMAAETRRPNLLQGCCCGAK